MAKLRSWPTCSECGVSLKGSGGHDGCPCIGVGVHGVSRDMATSLCFRVRARHSSKQGSSFELLGTAESKTTNPGLVGLAREEGTSPLPFSQGPACMGVSRR